MSDQKKMEEFLEFSIEETVHEQKDIMNGLLQVRGKSCSFEESSMTFEFPVLPWEENRVGFMHGGAMCTAFDFSMGVVSRFYAGSNWAPTVSLEVKYIRPVEMGDVFVVKCFATATGKRIIQLRGEAFSDKTGKLVATATGVYMSIDTTTEKRG